MKTLHIKNTQFHENLIALGKWHLLDADSIRAISNVAKFASANYHIYYHIQPMPITLKVSMTVVATAMRATEKAKKIRKGPEYGNF